MRLDRPKKQAQVTRNTRYYFGTRLPTYLSKSADLHRSFFPQATTASSDPYAPSTNPMRPQPIPDTQSSAKPHHNKQNANGKAFDETQNAQNTRKPCQWRRPVSFQPPPPPPPQNTPLRGPTRNRACNSTAPTVVDSTRRCSPKREKSIRARERGWAGSHAMPEPRVSVGARESRQGEACSSVRKDPTLRPSAGTRERLHLPSATP